MTRFKIAGGICLLLLAAMPSAAFSRDIGAAPAGKWTATEPPINFAHIATGEINRHGEAVGYHHRPNGIDPPGARVLRITQPPDANGVYSARVALRDPDTGEWIDKRASSTFFPDAMSDGEVEKGRLTAPGPLLVTYSVTYSSFWNAAAPRGTDFRAFVTHRLHKSA